MIQILKTFALVLTFIFTIPLLASSQIELTGTLQKGSFVTLRDGTVAEVGGTPCTVKIQKPTALDGRTGNVPVEIGFANTKIHSQMRCDMMLKMSENFYKALEFFDMTFPFANAQIIDRSFIKPIDIQTPDFLISPNAKPPQGSLAASFVIDQDALIFLKSKEKLLSGADWQATLEEEYQSISKKENYRDSVLVNSLLNVTVMSGGEIVGYQYEHREFQAGSANETSSDSFLSSMGSVTVDETNQARFHKGKGTNGKYTIDARALCVFPAKD